MRHDKDSNEAYTAHRFMLRGVLVPGAGLEPATFGCLRHHKGLARHTIALEAAL